MQILKRVFHKLLQKIAKNIYQNISFVIFRLLYTP